MDFTQRKLKKVAEEEDLMLSLYLENEVLYLESGTELLIVVSSLLFYASLMCQHVKCSSRRWLPLHVWLSCQVLCSVLVTWLIPALLPIYHIVKHGNMLEKDVFSYCLFYTIRRSTAQPFLMSPSLFGIQWIACCRQEDYLFLQANLWVQNLKIKGKLHVTFLKSHRLAHKSQVWILRKRVMYEILRKRLMFAYVMQHMQTVQVFSQDCLSVSEPMLSFGLPQWCYL